MPLVRPVGARAQQRALPLVGFVHSNSADNAAELLLAFHKGLGETGYVEGRDVAVELHWLEGQFDRVPVLMADLVRRRVAVIVALSNTIAIASKAATTTIPIVFGVAEDPVKLGLVATSLTREATRPASIFSPRRSNAKRLGLLHELLPRAVRIAVLVNPAEATNTETTLRDVQEAARAIGLEIYVLNATTTSEIDAAFATLARERPDALFVGANGLFSGRPAKFPP